METLKYKGFIGSIEVELDDNTLYGKVLGLDKGTLITYEGNTLYYVIEEASQTATLVAPRYPNYPTDELKRTDGWQGYEQPKGSVTVPEAVEYGGKSFPVSVLSEGAFSLCGGITSVKLPEGITTINRQVFDTCTGLTTINLPNSLTAIGVFAFCACESLLAINLPKGLTTIDDYAFASCSSLSAIELPSTVTTIGYAAFMDDISLTTITIPGSVKTIGDFSFIRPLGCDVCGMTPII